MIEKNGCQLIDDDAGIDTLLLDNQLCFPVYAASNLLVRAYGKLLKPLGLTYPQYLVMMVMWELKEATVGEIGSRLHLDSGTLTPLLKRMERSGLLTRRRCRLDERKVLIALTETGVALREQAKQVPAVMACNITADRDWLMQLKDDLHSLVRILETSQ